ncbi:MULTISPECIES: acetyl-CoA carboxylase biotin carboxylase subunit [Sorangium]|uniref:Biotin carboxylase n=1 Tax=Sorangium cellulosum (strain So ce56) TaxID=448385 RepID=A9EQ17_SORC5|nr:acetyl-CoA carboxylase biotin carboxylase subunit [Sorangium cellulosum]CAN94082.1 accC1 [Sorangium cellulosum So ce56]
MFQKILIANRGEIAMRVIRACRLLGIRTVAIHSEADAAALHVRFADEAVCVGPAEASKSYLNIPQIIAAAEVTGADAIHPGYGFLSENAKFAELCKKCRLTFIGPTAEAMRTWGDKVSAREVAKRFGIPMLSGTGVLKSAADAAEQADRVGYPVILKASGGGGGRGMRIVREASEVQRSFEIATQEALSGFKNPDVYLERYVEAPRHIEFQVLADQHGGVWTLGERECSLQRRHQKVMEESPSPAMDNEKRSRMGDILRAAILETGYTGLGTLEFLMDERGELFFMEMNTRVQVEHPVTEMVTGVDLVAQQILAAAGERLSLPDTRPWSFRGHAIECRINAEDARSFVPWPGLITEYHSPGGVGIRVDSGVYGGFRVPSSYDSLVAKVIAHGANRAEAIARLRCALDEFIIGGIRTNIPLHQALLRDPEVVAGNISTHTIERVVSQGF